jgi:hypothetical protein
VAQGPRRLPGFTNLDGYAGCAEESQIRDSSVRAGPTQYRKKVGYSDSGNSAAPRRFGGRAEYSLWWTEDGDVIYPHRE